ncbi:MAG: ankyrin repeat domain-containing protein [Vulcanimicrobiota bacterium]
MNSENDNFKDLKKPKPEGPGVRFLYIALALIVAGLIIYGAIIDYNKSQHEIEMEKRQAAAKLSLTNQLFTALNTNDLEKIQQILNENPHLINARKQGQGTVIHYASSRSNKEVIDFLLSKGARLGEKDREGNYPIQYAVKSGNMQNVNYMLEEGSNPNVKDNNSITPLHISIKTVQPRIASLLIDNGANIDARDNQGNTPLHYAVKLKNPELVRFLIKRGANPNIENLKGRTSFDMAEEQNLTEILNILKNENQEMKVR